MVDSYAKARPHLRDAEVTSDICSTEDERPAKPRPKRYYCHYDLVESYLET